MNEVTVEEMAAETAAVVARATRGESMVITDKGRPIALLLPPPSERDSGDGRIRTSRISRARP